MTVDTTQESTLLQSYDINLKFKHNPGKPHEHLSETSNSSKGSWLKNEEIKLSCKGKHTSKNFSLGENIKEIIYEEDLLLN